jgi:hypothetical protein
MKPILVMNGSYLEYQKKNHEHFPTLNIKKIMNNFFAQTVSYVEHKKTMNGFLA